MVGEEHNSFSLFSQSTFLTLKFNTKCLSLLLIQLASLVCLEDYLRTETRSSEFAYSTRVNGVTHQEPKPDLKNRLASKEAARELRK